MLFACREIGPRLPAKSRIELGFTETDNLSAKSFDSVGGKIFYKIEIKSNVEHTTYSLIGELDRVDIYDKPTRYARRIRS